MTRTKRQLEWVLASERRLAASQTQRWGHAVDLVDALAGYPWAKSTLGRKDCDRFVQVRDLINELCGRSPRWLAKHTQKKIGGQ